MMVATVEHVTCLVLAQVEVDSKSNEIPAVRELSSGLDLTGRIVTVRRCRGKLRYAPNPLARTRSSSSRSLRRDQKCSCTRQ